MRMLRATIKSDFAYVVGVWALENRSISATEEMPNTQSKQDSEKLPIN